jgi:hypothetical protein
VKDRVVVAAAVLDDKTDLLVVVVKAYDERTKNRLQDVDNNIFMNVSEC